MISPFKASFGSSGFEYKTEEDIKLRQFNTDINLESLKFNYLFLSRLFLFNFRDLTSIIFVFTSI
jgi:hypothetical protein